MIKKVLLFVLALVLSVVPASTVSAYSGNGSGTVGDPYVINTCNQLFEMNNNLSAHYVLAGYVDCTGATWGHIGTLTSSGFSGTFDGQGYTIQNLTVDDTNGVGLFTYVNGGTITNLVLDNFDVTGTGTVGALAAQADNATISSVRVTSSLVHSEYATGGLVGILNNSTVSDVSVYNSQILGRVSGGFAQTIGGLVGLSESNTYNRSFVTGTVDKVVTSGLVINIGGFIGSSTGDVVNDSYSTANVIGELNVGGFVGVNASGGFSRSYASGSVTGLQQVGGFSGSSALSMFTDSFATGPVTGITNVGGLIGRVQAIGGDVDNSTWDVTRTGQADCVGLDQGISYPTVCMTGINVASGMPNYFFNNDSNIPLNDWNFATVWQTSTGLPTLRTLPETPAVVRVVLAPLSIRVMWDIPTSDGGSPVTTYDLKYRKAGTTAYTTVTGITATSAPEYTLTTGLTPSTSYEIEVRTHNAIGVSPWLGFITATTAQPVITTPITSPVTPVLASSYVNNASTDTTDEVALVTEDDSTVTEKTPTTATNDTKKDTASDASTTGGFNPVLVVVIVVAAIGSVLIVIRLFVRK